MKHALWAALACACSTPATRQPVVQDPPISPADPPAAQLSPSGPSPSALVRTTPRKGRIEAPHGGAITNLAVTFDGTAAVTCDELGGIRLWPRLDGSVEPRAVELPRPEDLAIGRDPRGFVIAMTDSVGGLVIQLVDPDGITLQRAVLAGDPAYAGVAIGEPGAIGWRADQRVLRFNADGSVASQVAAEPGQRIVAIAVAGTKAVAVIESTGAKATRRARWLAITGELAWGAWIDAGGALGDQVALSPTARRLATLIGSSERGQTEALVFDTAKGTQIAGEMVAAAVTIGLPTDDHLALSAAGAGSITWIDLAKTRPRQRSGAPVDPEPSSVVEPSILGVGGGRAITATSGELLIATPVAVQYLGYELESPAVAAAAPAGKILIGLGDTFALLDGKLDAGPAPDLAVPAGSAIADLRWLAGDQWLVESSRINDGVTSIALVDVAQHKTTVVRTGMAMVHMLMYEPSTRLVTLSLGDAPEVLRHDPARLRLDRVAVAPKLSGFERTELVPVAPALAAGTQVIAVHMRDRLTVRWLRDPAALDGAGARVGPLTFDGSLAGVDAAGHVFVWQSDPQGTLELAVYGDGKRIGTLPTDGPTAVWPDPKGTRVVAVGQRSIRLAGIDGAVLWAQPLQGVTEALWLDDGTIGVISAAGVARLDAATGAVIAARCGWRFGLSAKQHPVSPRVEPVCTQLR